MSVYHNQQHQPDKQIILVELWQIGHQIKIWCLVARTLSLSLSLFWMLLVHLQHRIYTLLGMLWQETHSFQSTCSTLEVYGSDLPSLGTSHQWDTQHLGGVHALGKTSIEQDQNPMQVRHSEYIMLFCSDTYKFQITSHKLRQRTIHQVSAMLGSGLS